MRCEGHVARMLEMRNSYKILVGKPEGKRLLGRPSRRWANSITMDLKEIDWEVVHWMHLAKDWDHWRALVNMVMNLRLP